MAIYKKIKDKDVKVAENSIVDHSQLTGRDAYGCHGIQSIRKLPEKLTELKTRSTQNSEAIQQNSSAIRQNSEAISQNSTAIGQNSEAINSAFESINTEIRNRADADIGIENKANNISLTEEIVSNQKTGKLVFTDYSGNTSTVQGGFPPDNTSIILTQDNQLQAKGLVTQTGYLSGDVIKEVISAQGGYLDSHNFGTSTPTNQELTDYAIQNIGTITEASEIWDKTRVINLYDHHTWVWDLNSETWSDLGEIAQISDANNDGLHGLVTGAPNDGDHDYMGNIDTNGQIIINGLPELAQQVENNTNNISTNTTNISNNTTAINNEITNRQNADSSLQGQINLKEDISNKVTSISSLSTDNEYPSAKCVYDIVGNIVSLMEVL